MKIGADHRLYHADDTPYPFVESPNTYPSITHEYLVWHYTANNNGASAVNVLSTLKKPKSNGVSAHLVIDLDGAITQLVPFNNGAWHAGESHWEGKRWLNHYSIGIEIVNDGKLKRIPNTNRYLASSNKIYDDSEVLVAAHYHEFFEAGWPYYPQAQLEATFEVSRLLVEHYGLEDALGHEDIADARIGKVDPGPAFPKADFREHLFKRREPLIARYELMETVPVLEDKGRTPAFKYPARHTVDPIAAKTNLTVKKIAGDWALVKIKKDNDGWIGVGDLDLKSKTKGVTRVRATVYAFQPDALPPAHGVKTLPKGFPVRILREEKAFILIANLKDVPNYKVVQGWIPSGTLKRIEP